MQRLGRLDEALDCFGRAIALKADFADAHWRRSVVRLIRGDFQDGWPGFEWRFKCPGYIPRSFAQPMWNGDSLEGKTILLHAEQGLGDTIQFLRYVPLVKRRGGAWFWSVRNRLCRCYEALRSISSSVMVHRCRHLTSRRRSSACRGFSRRRWIAFRPTFPICSRRRSSSMRGVRS